MYISLSIYIYIYRERDLNPCCLEFQTRLDRPCFTPYLPTNIVPTNVVRLKLSGKFPMGLGIPLL